MYIYVKKKVQCAIDGANIPDGAKYVPSVLFHTDDGDQSLSVVFSVVTDEELFMLSVLSVIISEVAELLLLVLPLSLAIALLEEVLLVVVVLLSLLEQATKTTSRSIARASTIYNLAFTKITSLHCERSAGGVYYHLYLLFFAGFSIDINQDVFFILPCARKFITS